MTGHTWKNFVHAMGETEVRDTWTIGNKVFSLKITGWLFFGFCNEWKIKAIMPLLLKAWLQHCTALKKWECSQCENDVYSRKMLLNFKIKHWEWSVLVVASINFSNKGRTRSSNGHHRKHSSTLLLFSPKSKGNTRWPKYKPTAVLVYHIGHVYQGTNPSSPDATDATKVLK